MTSAALLAFLGPCVFLSVLFLFPTLLCTCILVLYLPVRKIREIIFKFPSLDIFKVPHALTALSGYQAPEVYPYVYRLNPNTTKPIGSPWFLSRIYSQGLTCTSLILS